MIEALQIIPADLLDKYNLQVDKNLAQNFESLTDSELSVNTFSFYTSVSAVYSSKIEGEDIELDSYIKHKRFGVKFLPDYTRKIDDLYNAYLFAQANALDEINIRHVHSLLTKHILQEGLRGKTRAANMYVTTTDGRIEYAAAMPGSVDTELKKLYTDIARLLSADLLLNEVFYFAAMLHLVFVKIHPFADGNGRTARLLEKWFLAQKLGNKAWFLQSEKNYYTNHKKYYTNIRALGLEYEILDYAKALPFLLMLPNSFVNEE